MWSLDLAFGELLLDGGEQIVRDGTSRNPQNAQVTKLAELFRSRAVDPCEYDQLFDLRRAFQRGDCCVKLVLADDSAVGVSEGKAAKDRIEDHTVG